MVQASFMTIVIWWSSYIYSAGHTCCRQQENVRKKQKWNR